MDTELDTNLNKAFNNYKIAMQGCNSKFAKLDEWLKKESTLFKNESKETTMKTYIKYDRGTIIKVDFGINIGSEMSNTHFAIVIDRYDNIYNNSIYVLPLTSKPGKYHYPLNALIVEEFTKRLDKEIKSIKNELSNIEKSNSENKDELISTCYENMKKVEELLDYYKKYMKNTFACINQIKVISKDRIFRPKNKFDIIGRSKCSKKTLDEIDNIIISRLTNIKVEEKEMVTI